VPQKLLQTLRLDNAQVSFAPNFGLFVRRHDQIIAGVGIDLQYPDWQEDRDIGWSSQSRLYRPPVYRKARDVSYWP